MAAAPDAAMTSGMVLRTAKDEPGRRRTGRRRTPCPPRGCHASRWPTLGRTLRAKGQHRNGAVVGELSARRRMIQLTLNVHPSRVAMRSCGPVRRRRSARSTCGDGNHEVPAAAKVHGRSFRAGYPGHRSVHRLVRIASEHVDRAAGRGELGQRAVDDGEVRAGAHRSTYAMPPLPDGNENWYVDPLVGLTRVQRRVPSCDATQMGASSVQKVNEALPPPPPPVTVTGRMPVAAGIPVPVPLSVRL